jgi:glucose/arabinose dehydrogenase
MSTRLLLAGVLLALVAAPAALAAPDPIQGVRVVDALPGVKFAAPIWIGNAPGDAEGLYVAEQDGRILRATKWRGQGQAAQPSVFLDITEKCWKKGQAGINGVAFHPGYAQNGRVFVFYVIKTASGFEIEISEFKAAGNVAQVGTEKVLLRIPKSMQNHNGGGMAFGPDGKLWIGTGDNQIEKEAVGTSQNPASLLGKILRIDVDAAAAGRAYGIPADNPWASGAGGVRPEVWAFGFRNPWRISFDAGGGLWTAIPGRKDREWIDKVKRGGNHGWPFRDGSAANPDMPVTPAFQGQQFVPPVFEYVRDASDSSTAAIGGYFYRGDRVPSLKGKYVFADYGRGAVYALTVVNDRGTTMGKVGDCPSCATVGEDAQGELYFAAMEEGRILTMAP